MKCELEGKHNIIVLHWESECIKIVFHVPGLLKSFLNSPPFFITDLSSRVDSVKEENLKLKSENQVLGQYIENLMAASSVFQSTEPKAKKK